MSIYICNWNWILFLGGKIKKFVSAMPVWAQKVEAYISGMLFQAKLCCCIEYTSIAPVNYKPILGYRRSSVPSSHLRIERSVVAAVHLHVMLINARDLRPTSPLPVC